MNKKYIILPLIFIFAEIGLLAEENNSQPTVAIQPLKQSGNPSLCEPISNTVISTLELTLKLMNRYQIISLPSDKWISGESTQNLSLHYGLDNIIQGEVNVLENGGISLSFQVLNPRTGKKSEMVNAFSTSFMGVFDITDELTIKLLEELTQEHLALGTLILKNSGPSRSFRIDLDKEFIGKNQVEFSMIPAGKHSIEIYEIIDKRKLTSIKTEIEILEGENLQFDFSLISGRKYEEFLEGYSITIEKGSFPIANASETYYPDSFLKEMPIEGFEIASKMVTNREFADVFNEMAEKGSLIIKKSGDVIYQDSNIKIKYKIANNNSRFTSENTSLKKSNKKFSSPDISKCLKFKLNEIIVPEGLDNQPVVNITWLGALIYCNLRSEKEGLEPCYNLKTLDCDFSKNGYRLPLEAEFVYALLQNENNDYSNTWYTSPNEEWEMMWDLYNGKKQYLTKPDQSKKSGEEIVLRYGRERKNMAYSKSFDNTGFRWVRSLDSNSLGQKRRNWGILRLDIGCIVGGMQYPNTEIFHVGISFGLLYRISPYYYLGINCNLIYNHAYSPDQYHDSLITQFHITPILIGNPSRFAVGFFIEWPTLFRLINYNYPDSYYSNVEVLRNTEPFIPFPTGGGFKIYIRSLYFSLRFGSEPYVFSIGVGYSIPF